MDLTEVPQAAFVRHPWETVRAEFFCGLVSSVLGDQPAAAVLDVGAGDAYFAAEVAKRWPGMALTCFDPGYETSVAANAPADVCFTAEEPAGQFDVLTLLDVLEHVEDDGAVLTHFVRERLRPGGSALISVPAWPRLFSNHDRHLRHYRRYAPAVARRLVEQAGLSIQRSGGAFHGPLLVRAITVLRERQMADRETLTAPAPLQWTRGERVRRLVEGALRADTSCSALASRAGFELPGLSWWALCRKP